AWSSCMAEPSSSRARRASAPPSPSASPPAASSARGGVPRFISQHVVTHPHPNSLPLQGRAARARRQAKRARTRCPSNGTAGARNAPLHGMHRKPQTGLVRDDLLLLAALVRQLAVEIAAEVVGEALEVAEAAGPGQHGIGAGAHAFDDGLV